MRQKIKFLVLAGVLVTMLVPLSGCTFMERLAAPIDRLVHPPSLDIYKAILIVQVSGVPAIDQYYTKSVGEAEASAHGKIGAVQAFGDWDAHYKGKGMWEITGPVKNDKWGECQTTWTINEKNSELSLTGFYCAGGQ